MFSLSVCKCHRDTAPGCSGIMLDAQCQNAHNNDNEKRNAAHARASPRVMSDV